MNTRIENALKEATIRTFEDVCFMYLVPELKDTQKDLALEAAAEVKYKGDYTGKLIIETRGGLFTAIATNMLSNEIPNSQQKKDALGEIANIICGNVVPSLGRQGGRGYKIESPKFLHKDELFKEEGQAKPLTEIVLNFNQGRADIKFFVDSQFNSEEKKD
jgi:CheY-specific phosphatase CheX